MKKTRVNDEVDPPMQSALSMAESTEQVIVKKRGRRRSKGKLIN
jgi:hypothetical protein